MAIAHLGLGANLGDAAGTIRAALDRLAAQPGIVRIAVSPLYRTPPWGRVDQPDFVNAAARVETSLPPRALLALCLSIEEALGRERGERWGPREIDIDILDYEGARVDEPGLVLPHPRLLERAFALVPLADLAPDLAIGGRSVREALAALDRTGITRIAETPGPHLHGAGGGG